MTVPQVFFRLLVCLSFTKGQMVGQLLLPLRHQFHVLLRHLALPLHYHRPLLLLIKSFRPGLDYLKD